MPQAWAAGASAQHSPGHNRRLRWFPFERAGPAMSGHRRFCRQPPSGPYCSPRWRPVRRQQAPQPVAGSAEAQWPPALGLEGEGGPHDHQCSLPSEGRKGAEDSPQHSSTTRILHRFTPQELQPLRLRGNRRRTARIPAIQRSSDPAIQIIPLFMAVASMGCINPKRHSPPGLQSPLAGGPLAWLTFLMIHLCASGVDFMLVPPLRQSRQAPGG